MKISAEYRGIARSNLKGNWGTAILVCLIVLLSTAILGVIPGVGYIATLLIAGPFTVAELNYFIKLHRKEDATINSMFENFGSGFVGNFFAYLLKNIFILLWTMLFIIPGIIKTYSYAMTMFLKVKEPQLGANQAITLSRQIMDGKKWNLFCLHFSFIGWIILSLFTFGIGLIFLLPYMRASETAFLEDLYTEHQQSIEEPIDVETFNELIDDGGNE